MSDIKKEVPTGLINGINKVFILANTPSQIDDVFMDGAIYTAFSVVGNVMTLVDAPTLSLFVDYSVAGSFIPATTDITFGDIKANVWSLLGQKPTSTNFSSEIVGDMINTVIRQVLRGRVASLMDATRIYRAGSLWFRDGHINLRYRAGGSLGAALEVGDTSATVDTTYLLANGYVEIGGDIVKYTSSTTSTIDGITGQTVEHLEGEKVVQLYEVPIDFETPNKLWLIKNNLGYCKIEVPYDDTNSYLMAYSMQRIGTKSLIALRGFTNDDLIEVQYTKHITSMGDDTDVNPLPDEFGKSVIAYLVAGTLALEKGMPNANTILAVAYDNLQNMYQFYTNTINVVKQTIRPISYRNK